ncbi:MAG: DNA mismatch repair endonuclease MutL [Bacteroidales bacterium]|jgi:DNA mismatch repair protein MutL|nr:DNA mismatch repair endonuclease MutL [Bacteroidales bacterium]
MSDIIQLLPDNIANQIAAGEVIQRPASVVKELIENAVDSGADEIELIIKDSGKTLIQVVDNGKGMSETDARLSFERHATSKLRTADDLFNIRTMGFRGEALASIAAIAHVELKTSTDDHSVGTEIIIEGSRIVDQSPCSFPKGTSVAVKNLFFNVPARRAFLKSDAVEMSHILEEFYRVALAHHEVSFSLYHNDKLEHKTGKEKLKSRIVSLMGKIFNENIVWAEQDTDFVAIQGFVGKPQAAKKTRNNQYLFVNNRYFRSPYIHNAIARAYQELIPEGYNPSYFLFFQVNPCDIDVNVHPTKTEIKFKDERVIYAILHSTIRKALAENYLTPSLDFDIDPIFNFDSKPQGEIKPPEIKINPDYNPFSNPTAAPKTGFEKPQISSRDRNNIEHWQKLYINETDAVSQQQTIEQTDSFEDDDEMLSGAFIQMYNSFVVTRIKSGLMIINQAAAHERILFEKILSKIEDGSQNCQKMLFPATIELKSSDAEIMREIMDELNNLGFDISDVGHNSFIINGTPTDFSLSENLNEEIEKWIDSFKSNMLVAREDKKVNIAKSMSKNLAIKSNRKLTTEEMEFLVNDLFACSVSHQSPSGKTVYKMISKEELFDFFN